MRRTARVAALLPGLAGMLAVGGCARGASLPDPLPTDVPFAYHLQTAQGSDGALLEGTLELQDGCLVVVPSSDGVAEPMAPVVPVLPIAVVEWDGTTLEVGGERAAVGEHISLGGGFHDHPGDAAFVPESCPDDGVDRYVTVGI